MSLVLMQDWTLHQACPFHVPWLLPRPWFVCCQVSSQPGHRASLPKGCQPCGMGCTGEQGPCLQAGTVVPLLSLAPSWHFWTRWLQTQLLQGVTSSNLCVLVLGFPAWGMKSMTRQSCGTARLARGSCKKQDTLEFTSEWLCAVMCKAAGSWRGFSDKAQFPQQQGEITGASLPLWAGLPISMLLAATRGKVHS